MTQAYYRKWRPRRWEDVIGQDHIIQTLRNAVAAERTAHAYLFAGPRGTGKTTTARLLAKAVNCLEADPAGRPCDACEHCQAVNQGRFLDLIEIDAASNTSVEDVRSLREKINFRPNQGRYKVYIIDEVHMLSTAAFNALLKTLEEPPAHAIFILATTEVHKIPATVLSRCQRHEFRRIPIQEITAYLRGMANEEKLEVEDGALALIARQSTGCLRDAISLLDQLASGGGAVSLALTQAVLGTAAGQAVILVLEDILKRDSAAGLEHLHQALDGGSDPRQFARQMVDYLRDLLLMRMGNPAQVEATPEQRAQMARHAQALEVGELLRVLRAFNQAAAEGRAAWHPALPLELAFLEAIAGEAAPPEAIAAPAPPAEPAARPRRMEAPEPKPAAPKAADSTPPVDEESSQEFQTIQREWRRITEAMRERDPKAAGLLNSCKPAGMRRGVLLLGCNGPFVKQQLEQPETLGQVRRVIAPVVGREIGVSVFVMGRKGERFPPDLDMEGLVAAALRDLGGEIVDIQ